MTVQVKITPYRWPFNPLTLGKDKMLGVGRDRLKEQVWRNLRAYYVQGMPATIQCRIIVFEITVSGYTELLLCLLSHKGTYTLPTTSTFISVYFMLLVLEFVEKGICEKLS